MRVRLLGEDLIAFRDSSGKVGLIQNNCPHRGASLFFGRNEESGLRCVYHGWKFDVDGQVRRHAERAGRERLQDEGQRDGLPVRRSAAASSGPTWARARTPPPLPDLEPNMLPDERALSDRTSASATGCRRSRATSTPATSASCTTARINADDAPPGTLRPATRCADRAPRYEVVDTDCGVMYGAYRPAEAGHVLLAHRPVPVPVLHHDADRRARAARSACAPGCRWTTSTR